MAQWVPPQFVPARWAFSEMRQRGGLITVISSMLAAACGSAVGSTSDAGSGGSSGSSSHGSTGSEGDGSSAATSSHDGATSSDGTDDSAPGGLGLIDCGAAGESCSTSLTVTGGTYDRTYTNDGTGATGTADPATVSTFRLDKYLVTVGRFRQFVAAWNGGAGYMPPPGSGTHTHVDAGNGLNATAGGYEPGWLAADDGNIAPTNANLACGGVSSTWTPSVLTQDSLPINCVNWWEAYAFCIWDGGFLPSEAEWEYAAAGGSQELEYPWGATDPAGSIQYAIYGGNYTANPTDIAPVGTTTLGAGAWGQLDMAGELWEWNLDLFAPYGACTDCAGVTAGSMRVIRGGDFGNYASSMLPSFRDKSSPEARAFNIGFRCARSP